MKRSDFARTGIRRKRKRIKGHLRRIRKQENKRLAYMKRLKALQKRREKREQEAGRKQARHSRKLFRAYRSSNRRQKRVLKRLGRHNDRFCRRAVRAKNKKLPKKDDGRAHAGERKMRQERKRKLRAGRRETAKLNRTLKRRRGRWICF